MYSLTNRLSRSRVLRFLLVGFLLPVGHGTLNAQASNYIFEHLTSEQGLSSDKVEAVLQDRDGFYWIATQNGLNRFDGTTFTIYRHDTQDSTSLTNNYCTALLEGKNGDIWVGTYKGVSRYIKRKGYFQQIYLQHPLHNTEVANRIYSMAMDGEGNIWMAGQGLWKYDVVTRRVVLFRHEDGNPQSLSDDDQINHIVYDAKNNGLWVSTQSEVNFLNFSGNVFYHRKNNPLQWKIFEQAEGDEITQDPKGRLWFDDEKTQHLGFFEVDKNRVTLTSQKVDYGVKAIKADPEGNIWIFYWISGSAIFHPETQWTDTAFFNVRHRHSMLTENATSLYVDSSQNYWIGSGKGISIYNRNNQYYTFHQLVVNDRGKEKEPLSITAIAEQDTGYIWLATNLGLYTYSFSDEKFSRINLPGLNKPIQTLLADGRVLWIGIDDHVYALDMTTGKMNRQIKIAPGVYFIRKAGKNDLWVGTWGEGIYHLDVFSNQLTAYVHDDSDAGSIPTNYLINGYADSANLWVGYNGGHGFSKFDPHAARFSHFQPLEQDSSGSNASTITAITKVGQHQLWLGTYGSGIFRYDEFSGTYTRFRQQDGLKSDYINSLVPDQGGNLWISTADGLTYFNATNGTLHALDIDLVFNDNDVVLNGISGLHHKLYFFCNHEFVKIDPSKFHPDTHFPQMVISRFRIFDHDVAMPDAGDEIQLSYRENFFSFEYSTIKTQPIKAVRYAYMLEGLDQGWNDAGNKQYASYTNVPHGKYTFKVRATNPEGEWSEALISIPLVIKPPFWRTWWFTSLCVLTVVSVVYGLYRYRIRHIEKLYALRAKLSQDLHDDIGASLSSINIYSVVAEREMEGNPGKAKEIIQQINANSKQVMDNMGDIVWAMHTASREGATLAGRIKNFGYELLSGKNIECRYDIDVQAERKLQKPEARRQVLLIIKEALNNVAKYSEAGMAEVKVWLEGTYLLITIADNGKGFSPDTARKGNGLHNMEDRVRSLGGSFILQTAPGKGTRIQSRIPIANISDT